MPHQIVQELIVSTVRIIADITGPAHWIACTLPRELPIHDVSLDDPDKLKVAYGDGSAVTRKTCFMAGRWHQPVAGEKTAGDYRVLAGHQPQRRREAANGFCKAKPSSQISSGARKLAEEPAALAS